MTGYACSATYRYEARKRPAASVPRSGPAPCDVVDREKRLVDHGNEGHGRRRSPTQKSAGPLLQEGLRERSVPERGFRGRHNPKFRYAVQAGAALHVVDR
jgi:hypothetical protein